MRKKAARINEYTTEYNLTEYGVFFHEVYLVSALYTNYAVSKKWMPNLHSAINEEVIKDIKKRIDEKKITLYK